MPKNSPAISLQDARSFSGPLSFNMMIKPAGSLCNLDCAYCYYLDKSEIYGGREPRMDLPALERFVKAYSESCESSELTFNWHGGEPLVLGLDFFKKAVEFERKYATGRTVRNTIQTNGTLLTADWARFLSDEGFLVGVSVDGPPEVHDKFRKDKGGRPSLVRAIDGIECLYKAGAQYNIMAAVSSASGGKGREVYSFLKNLGTRYIQFSPVVEHVKWPEVGGKVQKRSRPRIVNPSEEGAGIAPWSVNPTQFGRFLCDVFDEWSRADVGTVFVNTFESALANLCGIQPATCSFAQVCGGNAVVEHNGDVYACDHFVYPEYRLGNIFTDSLSQMMDSGAQVSFGLGKRLSLPGKCLTCKFLDLCNGGCPKHRFNVTESGQTGLNSLCEGYSMFFRHCLPVMEKIRQLIVEGRDAALVMDFCK